MSNIRVNITELLQVLECTPPEHNLMLVGNHGIGKSEILTQYFAERGMRVVALFLGQMADPGDLIGLPHKNEKTGKTVKVVLTIAHLDHTPEHCEPENLRALCQACHNRYDAKHRAETRRLSKQ